MRSRVAGRPGILVGVTCLISGIAVFGSLYLSEVAGFIPCRLCWYQRIAMYPLLPVLAVAFIRGDAGVWRYGLPLSIPGLAIAAYHVVIQHVPSVEPPVCAGDVPCSAVYVRVFDLISIPVMAGGAFLAITGLLLLTRLAEGTERRPAEASEDDSRARGSAGPRETP